MVDSKPLLQDRPPAYNTVPGAYEHGPQQQQQPQPHGYGSIPPPYAYPDGQGKSSCLCRSPAGDRRHPCPVPFPNLRWLWFNHIREELTNFQSRIFKKKITFVFTPAWPGWSKSVSENHQNRKCWRCRRVHRTRTLLSRNLRVISCLFL